VALLTALAFAKKVNGKNQPGQKQPDQDYIYSYV
jgi:hypothetical protein